MLNQLRKLKIVFFSVFFVPHFILWQLSSAKKLINDDVKAIAKRNVIPYKGFCLRAFLLQSDSYFRGLFYYRIGSASAICRWYAPSERTFIISRRTTIGCGAYFPHSYATIIYAKSIGRNFSCRQCTTIGNKSDFRDDERPVIGDNVQLGANVVIIGNVTIGNNVVIGAGSIITKDIPDDCVVAGNPAQIIKRLS